MALNLNTDLIAGVMAAGDPARQRAAAMRLERLAQGAVATPAPETTVADTRSFSQMLADVAPRPPAPEPPEPARGSADEMRVAFLNRAAMSERATPAVPEALKQFEAVALQSFLGAMMPKEPSFAGGGTAGQMWSSLLTEQIAATIAGAGGIGIAQRLADEMPATDAGEIRR
jgi:hypothetical protein